MEGVCKALTLIHLFCILNLSDPSEKVSLQIMSKGPIVEGDNVTLKCHADGNPSPSSYVFHIMVSQCPDFNLKHHNAICSEFIVGHIQFMCSYFTIQTATVKFEFPFRNLFENGIRFYSKGKLEFNYYD